ncbi:MAG TPA: YggT family protein [Gemmatimonadaceae bacterium]|nr:YggT family protein [Gemmatimonadaceae bacterium]
MIAIATAYAALRVLVFVAAVVATVGAVASWLVRTRRISPFSGTARTIRRATDPWIVPMERRVVRAGGTPASAPWWTLALVIVGGIILLSLVQFLLAQFLRAGLAISAGPVGIVRLLVTWAFALLEIALLVRVLSSWVGGSPYSKWFRWSFVLTEWMLAPLRRIVPTIGMIDITPIVAYFLLRLAQSLVLGVI